MTEFDRQPRPAQAPHPARRPRGPVGTTSRWDLWARPAGFSSLHAALVWAMRHTADAADPIRVLADRLQVPYQVLLAAVPVQEFLHSSAAIAAKRGRPAPNGVVARRHTGM